MEDNNRTVLFLYPDFKNAEYSDQKVLTQLICDIKLIINRSNDNIQKILQNGSFSYTRYLPNITMEEINKNPEPRIEDLVRVCIVGHNNIDYTNQYDDICQKYVKNKNGISHLIGLVVKNNKQSVYFFKPSDSKFDVIIEASLNELQSILISIMLDTSLYHYFSLDCGIQYRKAFSKRKVEWIKDSNFSNIYDPNIDWEKIDYLSFSYPYVKQFFQNIKESDEANRITNKLIQDYFDFIVNHVCQTLTFNDRKELLDPYHCGIDDQIRQTLCGKITDNSFVVGKKYIVAIRKNPAFSHGKSDGDKQDFLFLEINDNIIERWLVCFESPLTDYALLTIKVGD